MPECKLGSESCGFQCTGVDFSDVWDKLHHKIVPQMKDRCYNCGAHAEQLFTGLHDHVNAGLGKPVHNKKNYADFVREVNCTYDRCTSEGRC